MLFIKLQFPPAIGYAKMFYSRVCNVIIGLNGIVVELHDSHFCITDHQCDEPNNQEPLLLNLGMDTLTHSLFYFGCNCFI